MSGIGVNQDLDHCIRFADNPPEIEFGDLGKRVTGHLLLFVAFRYFRIEVGCHRVSYEGDR